MSVVNIANLGLRIAYFVRWSAWVFRIDTDAVAMVMSTLVDRLPEQRTDLNSFPDEASRPQSRQFLIDVDHTLESLRAQEDTDHNMQITIEDTGPKVCSFLGFKRLDLDAKCFD